MDRVREALARIRADETTVAMNKLVVELESRGQNVSWFFVDEEKETVKILLSQDTGGGIELLVHANHVRLLRNHIEDLADRVLEMAANDDDTLPGFEPLAA